MLLDCVLGAGVAEADGAGLCAITTAETARQLSNDTAVHNDERSNDRTRTGEDCIEETDAED
jgi:hypothetical protein